MDIEHDPDEARRSALSPVLDGASFRPLSSTVEIELGARSHSGSVQPRNEDHHLVLRLGRSQETLATSLTDADLPARFEEFGYAMVVADGLGQTGSGAVASRVALSTLAHLLLRFGQWDLRVDPQVASDIVGRVGWL